MDTHTPGPWIAYYSGLSGHYSTARITSESDGHDIAALIPNGKNDARHVANLALIAAAPDMLAALHKAVIGIGPLPKPRGGDAPALRMMRDAQDACRAAIAKATGQ